MPYHVLKQNMNDHFVVIQILLQNKIWHIFVPEVAEIVKYFSNTVICGADVPVALGSKLDKYPGSNCPTWSVTCHYLPAAQ